MSAWATPSGSFHLTVRAYQPLPSLLDGSYKLPPVRRVPGHAKAD